MHIVHFLSHYPYRGGTTKAVHGLADALADGGHQVEVWTNWTDAPAHLPADSRATLRVLERSWMPFFLSSRACRAIESGRGDIDLVVLHGMFNPLFPALARLLVRLKVPYVLCPHVPYHPDLLVQHSAMKRFYYPLERWVLNHSAAVQLHAGAHERYLRAFGVTAPVIVVPNGFAPEEAEIPPAREPKEMLLFFGRIDPYVKGLDLLLPAFAAAQCETGAAPRLTLQGPDWGGRKAVEALVDQLALRDVVKFKDADYVRRPVEIIVESQLLVATSRWEGFGFTILEGMLAGVPVLATSEAGASEYVTRADCGWVAEPAIGSISHCLRSALGAQAEWRSMGARGRAFALKNLSWHTIAERAAVDYEAILRGVAR